MILVLFHLLFLSTGLVVVDCSASSETMGVLHQVLDLGCCIVLANKKPLTAAMVTSSISQLGPSYSIFGLWVKYCFDPVQVIRSMCFYSCYLFHIHAYHDKLFRD